MIKYHALVARATVTIVGLSLGQQLDAAATDYE